MSAPEPAVEPLGSSIPDSALSSVSVALSGPQPHPVVAAVLAVTPIRDGHDVVVEYRDDRLDDRNVIALYGDPEPIAARQAAAVLDWAARELWNDDYPEATGCLDAIVDGLRIQYRLAEAVDRATKGGE